MDKLETSVVDKLPRYIQVHSTLEFTRLVCALERAPRVSFSHNHDGKKILSVQMDVLQTKTNCLLYSFRTVMVITFAMD